MSSSDQSGISDALNGAAYPLFWATIAVVAFFGIVLAHIDDSNLKHGGTGPAAHIGEIPFDSMDALFSEGPGLEMLQVCWRVCSLDGITWTLFSGWSPRDPASSLGVRGMFSSLFSIVWVIVGLFSRKGKKTGPPGKPSQGYKEDRLEPSFGTRLGTYTLYARLSLRGLMRDYAIRGRAILFRDQRAIDVCVREKWVSGWVDFYLRNHYAVYEEVFHRPIASAPDATVGVVRRYREGGTPYFNVFKGIVMTKEFKRCVNLASYNYLGFGGIDEDCTPAARAAMMNHTFSACASRTNGGTLKVHTELEAQIARFLDKDDAIVLGMGFATNSTILPALLEAQEGNSGVLVLSDALNHKSIVEGVRLSGASVRAFPHNDMASLENLLQQAIAEGQGGAEKKPWRKVFIVVEGIYSMEGDYCRLREIVSLKNKYRAYLYLDEAHSIGAVGPRGRGVTELLGVPTAEVEIMMGTFTKSFGSAGGYVAASREIIQALRRSAPGSLYASAMSPPCAAQALAALRVITGASGGSRGLEKIAQLKDNTTFFRKRLLEEGFRLIGDMESPIIPAMTHLRESTAAMFPKLIERGIATVFVGYPAVPLTYERARFCISASHTRPQLMQCVKELVGCFKENHLYDRHMPNSFFFKRAKADAEYFQWLKTCPMVTSGSKQSKPEVHWKPEPVAPRLPNSSVADDMLNAAEVPEQRVPSDFRIYDSLGFVAQPLPEAQNAAVATLETYGFGACGPRGFYGTTMPHLDLESQIAEWFGQEAAILYSSAISTASSVLSSLIQRGDRVIVDVEVGFGILAGLRLTKSSVTWVQQGDIAAIEEALAKDSSKGRPKHAERRTFIVAEAISERTGKFALLTELVALKERYGAQLILDESLSLAALGSRGRGLAEMCEIEASRIDAVIGSLEHSMAGVGGFCVGRKSLIEHQRLAGSGYCFSAACPPSACSYASAIVAELCQEGSTDRRRRLRANCASLHAALRGALTGAEGAPVDLLSSPGSYVQVLRWTGSIAEGDDQLVRITEYCKSLSGVRLQVFSPASCGAEASFAARLRMPRPQAPAIIALATAEHGPADFRALDAALSAALVAC